VANPSIQATPKLLAEVRPRTTSSSSDC